MYQQQGRSSHEESLIVPSLSSADHLSAPRVCAIGAWSATALALLLLLLLSREPAPIPRPFEARHHGRIARTRICVPLSNAASKVARVVPVAVIRSSGGLAPSLPRLLPLLPVYTCAAPGGGRGQHRSRMGVTERDANADRVRAREGRAQRGIDGRCTGDATVGVDRRTGG